MAREIDVPCLRVGIVTAGQHPVRAAAHRPYIARARIVGPDLHLPAQVRDHERAARITAREVADLNVFILSCGDIEAVERRPIDLREALLDIRVVEAAGAVWRGQRERALRHPEMAERFAGARRSAAFASSSIAAAGA